MYKIVPAFFFVVFLAVHCFGQHEIRNRSALHLYVPSKSAKSQRIISVEGKSFGWDVRNTLNGSINASISRFYGEVVFSTAMTGYVESLTDPSYACGCEIVSYYESNWRGSLL